MIVRSLIVIWLIFKMVIGDRDLAQKITDDRDRDLAHKKNDRPNL